MEAQFIGWIGNIGFFIGGILVSQKKISGLYCQLTANILYTIHSLMIDNQSLLWLSIILALVNVYGIYNWSIRK